jgi:hypothetical protein
MGVLHDINNVIVDSISMDRSSFAIARMERIIILIIYS